MKNVPVTIAGKTLRTAQEKIAFVQNLLSNAGFPAPLLPMYVTQVMLESAWLTSNIAKKDLNLSGIKMASSPANIAFQKKLGVTRGSAAGYGEGNYHARYPNLIAWAQDYKRILSRGTAPLNAVDHNDFVERLYKNGYFTAEGYTAYKKGFSDTLVGIRSIIQKLGKNPYIAPSYLAIIIATAFFLVLPKIMPNIAGIM